MRRGVLVIGFVAAVLSGCGGASIDDDPRMRLRTPPPYVGAPPLPSPTPLAATSTGRPEPRPTAGDARRARAVLAAWAAAVRRGDAAAAGEHFVLPAVVSQPSRGAVEVMTHAVLAAFHKSLRCGARLLGVRRAGRYVIGTFRLTTRPRHTCDSPGARVQVGFVFGDAAHPRRFTEWWQAPEPNGTPPGPASRPVAPPADESSFGTQ